MLQKVFQKVEFYQGKAPSYLPWSYLIIEDHALASHFTLIEQLLNDRVELPDKLIFCAGGGDGFIGYRNRKWVAAAGNLHLTIFLKPLAELEYLSSGFTVLAAVSVMQVLNRFLAGKPECKIRWVNDIVFQNRKIAGVLSRTQVRGNCVESAQIGIGINIAKIPEVEPDLFVPGVTCLQAHRRASLQQVFRDLIQQLNKNYELYLAGRYDQLWQEYIDRSVVIGRRIEIHSDPYRGDPELQHSGVVNYIGKNLEIYLNGISLPVTRGRVVLR